jgi:glycosyltransferase involved in cell wall biosynthesis
MAIPAGLAARRISRKPLVVHVHATEFDRSPDGGNAAIREIERAGMQAAERVVTVSHYSRNLILNRYGIRPEKVLVVHNAVSRRTAGPVYHVRRRSAQKLVLFLGRLTYQKGPDYFIEAAAKVLKVLPGVLFVMAGTGDLLPSLVRRVARLRIGDRFHFTGFLEGEWVERTYAMSDLYVMPSVSEPFGIAPLEAMLCDVPVIVSTHSGVAEVLTHALKVDFWNTDELANQMIAALTHTALTAELRRNAREEVRQLTWNTAAESLLALYRQLAPHARS